MDLSTVVFVFERPESRSSVNMSKVKGRVGLPRVLITNFGELFCGGGGGSLKSCSIEIAKMSLLLILPLSLLLPARA